MAIASATEGRHNSFGLLRLLFASLVVVAHSPELIDGDNSREIATRLFGTLSFGEIAVDGFFLISGFLIAKSYRQSADLKDYLTKRILRIYPAYLVAYLLSMVVVGPLAGATMPASGELLIDAMKPVFLLGPVLPNTFDGLAYPTLNGSVWTIAYEFRCYLLVAVLGLCGVLGRRSLVLALTVFLIALHCTQILPQSAEPFVRSLVGIPGQTVRLCAAFLVGTVFYLYRDAIAYRGAYALAAATLLIPTMFSPRFAEAAAIVLGGYIVFWFAFRPPPRGAGRLLKDDVSYGLYLYAWPIQNTIVYYDRTISPWVLTPVTLAGAAMLGFVSWRLIERPALALKRRIEPRRGSDALVTADAPGAG